MNMTQINWNTEKPKFEEVEGKPVIVKWMCDGGEEIDGRTSVGFGFYMAYFDNNFLAYTILTEKTCKWTPEENDFTIASCCNEKLIKDGEYCPRCGARIEIVKELEPLPYKGKLPRITKGGVGGVDFYFVGYVSDDNLEEHVFSGTEKEVVIKKWNAFVEGK